VIDPATSKTKSDYVSWHASLGDVPATDASVIVFAVKPQSLEEILPQYRAHFEKFSPLYLSIAAGKPISFFKKHLGEHAQIVRAMPNTPGMVGAGITALYAESSVGESARHLATRLMDAAGKNIWLDKEEQMHAATALSGSGPAYVFYMLEAMVAAGTEAGLSSEIAKKLAVETLTGSCLLAELSHEPLAELRKNVTSPGGTTEAALGVLQAVGWSEIFKQAILKAVEKSKELSK
jgi:pyrroline-5-carboxylate reductase